MSSSEQVNNSSDPQISTKPSTGNVVVEGNRLGSYSLINPLVTDVVEITPRIEVGTSSEHRIESFDPSDDGEGTDVEIEQVDHKLGPLSPITQASDAHYAGTCRGKRTAISLVQKAFLEEFFRAGMTSASMQHANLHAAAAEKTGLEIVVIKNWIRNRRRPGSIKSAEKIASIISATNLSHIRAIPSIPGVGPPIPSLSSGTVLATPISLNSVSIAQNSTIDQPGLLISPPPPKRVCTNTISVNPAIPGQSVPTLCSVQSPHVSHYSPAQPQADSLILVKVRISGDGDEDFVEVEVPSLTYSSLLASICEELEIVSSNVAKIRKLPNVLVRKDKDVQRLKDGQELEVILSRASEPHSLASDHMSQGPNISTQNMLNGQFTKQQNGAY